MKILRELGSTESLYWRDNLIFTNNFIVNTQIDFNNQIDLVNRSISKWQEQNPILKCKISTHLNRDEEEEDKKKSRYFFELADESLAEENVLFLRFKNDTDIDLQTKALKLITQYESLGEFIGRDNLLWRILFIRLSSKEENILKYCIIFSANHSIYDGYSSFSAILRLFKIIEETFLKPRVRLAKKVKVNTDLLPCVEYITGQMESKGSEEYYEKKLLAKPLFLNESIPDLDATVYFKDRTGYDLIEGNEKLFKSMAVLEKKIKAERNFDFVFILESSEVIKMIEKCKHYELKVNGCINMVILIAMKLTYEKYCFKPVDKIIYFNSVSLRSFMTEKDLKNKETLGYISNSLYKEFDFDSKSTNKPYVDFWENSFRESSMFHDRFLKGEQWQMDSKRSKWIKPPPNTMHFHYIFSNLGTKQAALPNVSLIKIKEHYKYTNLFKTTFSGLLFGSISTLENKMYWSLSFDTENTNYEFASYLVKQVKQVLKDLLTD